MFYIIIGVAAAAMLILGGLAVLGFAVVKMAEESLERII